MVKHTSQLGPRVYRLLYQSLRRQSGLLRGGLAWLVVLAVFAALVGNTRYFVDRTAVIVADTMSLQVHFDESKHWLIEEGMTLCRPNPDLRAALESQHPICKQFLPDGTYTRLAIDAGDVLDIRVEADQSLLVRFLPCENLSSDSCVAPVSAAGEIRPRDAPNGFLVISPKSLQASGLLSLSGRISLGRDLASGGRSDFLWGGTYEIREQNWLTRILGRRSVTLERGELIPGSAVEIVSNNLPSTTSNGHFFPAIIDDQMVLKVVALSGGGDGAIRVSVSGADPFTIDPDWIDSVIANPIFLALAFLLGILLNALQLASTILRTPSATVAQRPQD